MLFAPLLLCLGFATGSSIVVYHDPVLTDFAQHRPHVVFTLDTADHRRTLSRLVCCSQDEQLLCVPKSATTVLQAARQRACRFNYSGITFAVASAATDLDPRQRQRCFVKTNTGISTHGLATTADGAKWTFVAVTQHAVSPLAKRVPYGAELLLRLVLVGVLTGGAFVSWFLVYGRRVHKRFVF